VWKKERSIEHGTEKERIESLETEKRGIQSMKIEKWIRRKVRPKERRERERGIERKATDYRGRDENQEKRQER
jgi:hypothetical protein